MPFGYHGSYLRIDVSSGAAEHVPLSDAVLRQFIGGSGLGVKLLLDEGAAQGVEDGAVDLVSHEDGGAGDEAAGQGLYPYRYGYAESFLNTIPSRFSRRSFSSNSIFSAVSNSVSASLRKPKSPEMIWLRPNNRSRWGRQRMSLPWTIRSAAA